MALSSVLYTWQHNTRQWLTGCRHRLFSDEVFPQTVGEPSRVVLVIAGMIGDSVMSTPLIVEARRLWPKAHITLLGQQHNCELLAACPLIDERVEARALPFSIRGRRTVAELASWVQTQRFDVAIIGLGDQFAALLADAKVPIRVGVRGHLLSPCLTHTYDAGTGRTWGPAERLNALRCLGLEVHDAQPRLWVSAEARATAIQKLDAVGLSADARHAVIHPFGSTARQRWPIDNVSELAKSLWENRGLHTVLIGGREARGSLAKGKAAYVIDATGQLTLQELLAVIERAELAVSTDSGPFHMAGALGCPLIGLFRASRPEHASRYPKARVMLGRDDTCARRCRWDRCRSEPCRQMANITVQDVVNLLELSRTDINRALSCSHT